MGRRNQKIACAAGSLLTRTQTATKLRANLRTGNGMVHTMRCLHDLVSQVREVRIMYAMLRQAVNRLIEIVGARAELSVRRRERFNYRFFRQFARVMCVRVVDDKSNRANMTCRIASGDPARRI